MIKLTIIKIQTKHESINYSRVNEKKRKMNNWFIEFYYLLHRGRGVLLNKLVTWGKILQRE